MKITVIELLNKMASDEEVPTKIKYNYITWEWNEKQKDYIELNGATRNLFTYYLDNLTECLNYKVEIIEEPKEELEEIELIDIHYVNDKCIFKVYGQSIEETIAIKVNELIDEVNKLKKERIRNNE